MTFNSSGKLARFYLWSTSDDKLPQDLCTYFWGLVARVVFILVMGGGFLFGLVYLLGTLIMWGWKHKLVILGVLLVAATIAFVTWVSKRVKGVKIEVLSEVKAIISSKVDAVKNRYCPRIEWK